MKRSNAFTQLGIVLLLISSCSLKSNAQLKAGDIMFVGFNADGNDGFSIVALVDIPAESTVYFTDNEWNGLGIGEGGAFNNHDEWELTWDTGSTIIPAGLVVIFNETSLSSNDGYGVTRGTILGNIKLTKDDEVLYTFQGTDNFTPLTFLSAIASDGFNDTNGTLTKTDLTAGINAISISGDKDIMIYTGSTECDFVVAADCASNIANPNNWATEDGAFDQSADGNFPDFPADIPPFFGDTPLPIELMSFNLIPYKEHIQVVWKTASETDNDFFTIERSKDGFSWEKVIKLHGAGNSSSILEYTSPDKYPHNGISYYRLKQTDFDGQFSYSDIKSITFNKSTTNNIRAYPNPTYSQLTIEGAKFEHFKIYNMWNQDVSNQVNPTQISKQGYVLDLSNLTQGVYIVKTKTSFIKVYMH